MKELFITLFLTLLAMPYPAVAAPLPVVASFSILGDMVKEVGGDAVEVKILVGPDADTHTYQPTPDDAKALATAPMIFVNGLGFEGWMHRLIEASGTKGVVVTVSEGVKPRVMEEDGAKVTDPHAWQDLANGRIYVKNIAAALEKALPDQATIIAERATKYDAELMAMDAYVRQQFDSVPKKQRVIITSHDAFGYFGAAYGVKFLAPLGMNTESEAAPTDIVALMKQVKQQGVKQLFIENMSNPKLITQIAKDTGATMGGTLYSDALSPPDGAAPTYLAMFRNNVPKLKAAMEGNEH